MKSTLEQLNIKSLRCNIHSNIYRHRIFALDNSISIFNNLISRVISIFKLKIQARNNFEIAVAYYSDHILTLIKFQTNSKNYLVQGVIELPIPGDIIGNNSVDNPLELSEILLDMLMILKLKEAPLLII